ncbi:uncharacterized protein [Nicotiana sylvestris]|uniref:uncharacterized protein n=1 Tax=Nicotiana sylvestris TaxID=4096 RepID=UPI00388CB1D4
MRMLEELSKRIEINEKKIEDNDKKVETYNSRVDQIPGAPPVLKGLDAKKFIQKPSLRARLRCPFPKNSMPDIPKYNGTTDPNEHITSYTCEIKGNELNDDEIQSVSDGANGIPSVSDDWAVQTFMQGLNERSLIASRQLKHNLIEYPVVTWSDVHNYYQSKIRVEDDQLGAPSGSVYPNRFAAKPPRDADRESRSNNERYQPYVEQRNNGSGRNAHRNDRRNDRGQSSRGLMSKSGFDKHTNPMEVPQLSEYNFSVDASGIVSTIGRIKDTRWPRPIQTDTSQRNPNLMCKNHGTHGHRTKDCWQIREEVAQLFNKGHL